MKDLPLFNWSLSKTLKTVPDILERAKIKVFVIIYVLNYPKLLAAIYDHVSWSRSDLLLVDIVGLVITTITLKLLLSKPRYVNILIHIVQILSAFSVFRILNIHKYGIDILITQHVYMLIVFSFYGLGRKWGILYSTINIFSVIFYLLQNQGGEFITESSRYSTYVYIFIVLINFLVLALSHYYFHAALYGTLEEKKELTDKLKKTAKDKTDFLSTMSHELRTPLNSVIGMTNILLNDNPNKQQIENLNVLKFSAENLLSLINNILDFNKIDSGNIEMEKLPFNIAGLLNNIGSILDVKAKEKNLDLFIYIDENIKSQNIIGDPTRLSQIIFNIAGNAIKFTEHGSININAKTVRTTKSSIAIRFEIKDTGIGISEEKQKLIFEPFKQASRNVTRKYGGTGLGLPIAKHLIELSKSQIEVKSKLKEGTTFSFEITYPITELPIHETLKIAPEVKNKSIENLRILLAEDNEMNVLFMKKLLSNWNIKLRVVENGQKAIEAVIEQDFDVILMDIHMPVMDGYKAAQMIRNMEEPKKASTHIIALTASTSSEIEDIKEKGIDDYLSKPFSIDSLKEKLTNIPLKN
ncbi:ATP-binding protein [Pseudopedobacter sp.]|uniref:ATP-binding protein n=1 Tax=Pseudopedobacter sp. TaxID=1936787 RepID=UPI00333F6B62